MKYSYLHRYLFIFCLLTTSVTYAGTVSIATASNFTDAMKEIAHQFRQETGHKTVLSFSSSGKIYAQIRHGAPFDVFLSADSVKPIALEKNGYAVKGSRFTYALGTLAVWAPEAKTDVKTLLASGQFKHLAIAQPKLAPYGQAAQATLQTLSLHEQLKHKLVLGENITQVYQFVATKNAQLGFVALSQLIKTKQSNLANVWIVPAEMHQPIQQDAVLLKRGVDNIAAKAWMQYLKSAKAKAIINAYGYSTLK